MSKRLKLNTVLPTLGWDVTLKILYELTLAYIDDIAVLDKSITMESMDQNVKNLGLVCSIHSKVYTGRIKQLYTKSKQLLYTAIFSDMLTIMNMRWRYHNLYTRSITTYWDGYKTKQHTREFIHDLCAHIKRYCQFSEKHRVATVITRDYDDGLVYKVQIVTSYILNKS